MRVKIPTGYYFIVDREGYKKIAPYNWSMNGQDDYVSNAIVGQMHRFILGYKCGERVRINHKNNKRHDNRICNLYVCESGSKDQKLRYMPRHKKVNFIMNIIYVIIEKIKEARNDN